MRHNPGTEPHKIVENIILFNLKFSALLHQLIALRVGTHITKIPSTYRP